MYFYRRFPLLKMYSGLLKMVGTKPVCFSPMCNAFLLACPALLAQAYAGTGEP